MSQFQYKPRSPEAWDKRAKGTVFDGYALDEFQTFSPKKENWIRILPPTWENANHYGFDLWVHYGVGPNNGTVICLYKMKNQACPICEAQRRAEAKGNEQASKELKPSRRVLVWLLDRKEEKQPLLWAMGWTIDRDITKICRDRKSGELYFIDDHERGYDISFDKEGEGVTTKYTGFQLDRNPSSVDAKHIDYILEHPVPTVLNWRTYEEVQSLFEGQPLVETKPEAASQPQASAPAPVAPPPAVQAAPAPVAAPPAAPPPVQAAPPPPPKQFVSSWTNTNCSQCGQPQYTISETQKTCQNGHVEAMSAGNGQAAPPPAKAAAPEGQMSGTDRLRARFSTGQK